jgi:hypothetical protein
MGGEAGGGGDGAGNERRAVEGREWMWYNLPLLAGLIL